MQSDSLSKEDIAISGSSVDRRSFYCTGTYGRILQSTGKCRDPGEESLIWHGDYTIQGGVRGLEELVQKNPDMTAVFVTNYEMTMGAMIGVNELGIRIPEQLSVIGFDNLQFARACNPKLTIVAQPTDGIAKEVAKVMLKHLENTGEASGELFSEKLQTEIIEGKSVKVL